MPPQPGMFSMNAGPSRIHGNMPDDGRKDRKRKEVAGRLSREMNDRRDDTGKYHAESIQILTGTALQLATRPDASPAYNLRLYPLTIERSALVAQISMEERRALDLVETAYEEERDRVEEEFKRGRDRIRERLMEGIEERRRRAREEKDGEGNVGDALMDSQSRPHITRKLRNKLGPSPPHSPIPISTTPNTNPGPVTASSLLNPHSLSVDELPSPFPLPLTSTQLPNGTFTTNVTANGRRRNKAGGFQTQTIGGLGKSLAALNSCKEIEIEADLGDIRRGNKRRRNAAAAMTAKP